MPKDENSHTAALVNVVSNVNVEGRWTTPVAILEEQSIVFPEVYCSSGGFVRIQEIIDYKVDEICPKDKSKIRKLRSKATQYYMFGGQLYKTSFSGPMLMCIGSN